MSSRGGVGLEARQSDEGSGRYRVVDVPADVSSSPRYYLGSETQIKERQDTQDQKYPGTSQSDLSPSISTKPTTFTNRQSQMKKKKSPGPEKGRKIRPMGGARPRGRDSRSRWRFLPPPRRSAGRVGLPCRRPTSAGPSSEDRDVTGVGGNKPCPEKARFEEPRGGRR